MNGNLIEYIIIFVTVFFSLSLARLAFNFIRALFSNPPKKFVLEFNALLYYGICISFLLTLLITKTV